MNLRLLKTLMKEQLFPALAAFGIALVALLVSCMVFAGNTAIENRIQIWPQSRKTRTSVQQALIRALQSPKNPGKSRLNSDK
ncbi:MAG: hypothetical protein LIO54_04370 [Oscillospiraceae bacterium]|nr:hypothetical protein [Oscillospiraceae bacterium]